MLLYRVLMDWLSLNFTPGELITTISTLIAAIAGVLVLVQRWRYKERPHWALLDIALRPGMTFTGETRPRWDTIVRIANHGDGSAYDVQLWTLYEGRWVKNRQQQYAKIAPGEAVKFYRGHLPEGPVAPKGTRDFMSGDGMTVIFPAPLCLSWRQRPGWGKLHTQVFDLNVLQLNVNVDDWPADGPAPFPPPAPTPGQT